MTHASMITFLKIVKYRFSKFAGLEYCHDGPSPTKNEFQAWLSFDIGSLLPDAQEKEDIVSRFGNSFLKVIEESMNEFDATAYNGVKALVEQVAGGAFGGMTQSTADSVLARLPPAGHLCQTLKHFLQVGSLETLTTTIALIVFLLHVSLIELMLVPADAPLSKRFGGH